MTPALLPLAPSPPYPKPPRLCHKPSPARPLYRCDATRRDFAVYTASAAAAAMSPAAATAADEALPSASPSPTPHPPNGGATSLLVGIANTRSWSQYYGSGFSIRVPPSFDDILEPEDFSAAMTYYGDKAKVRAYAARFASPDRLELVSVVIKPSNQLKITFLEAKDITELGTLKEASKLFVPGGAKIYSARTIKVKDQEGIRTYYFYEFRFDRQHVALMATVDSGKLFIMHFV
ncbi:uncharacterized protein [Triticum aestivum]|uniref:uncharacterized protein isoform X3 n=1 Tax=Triticum aestivum TaxID=4565 RepID=UPI001D01F30F|nr:uncharacterized protein LOC123110949 isoform X3 [Triticum aestivum]